MASEPIITRELPALPRRADDAHKGAVGRIAVIGGCADETMMIGAPALTGNAALRSGAGLVQLIVPESIRRATAVITPCSTIRALPHDAAPLLEAVAEFQADVVALAEIIGAAIEEAHAALHDTLSRRHYRSSVLDRQQITSSAMLLVKQGDMEVFKGRLAMAKDRFDRALELDPGADVIRDKMRKAGITPPPHLPTSPTSRPLTRPTRR